ncbi:hypothetical protein EYZ11_002378 [Aspergillus tanneri]|uniref:ADF-H domain-containing protein n=1 Tax=Aspergillus tanneri TaxID=1220188 RepID=A0A4V3UQ91_9EURO|nr:hypothetical protein EYZ11_002378 [Aspergillus tanneri]
MSLNGLENPAVLEAYQIALSEAGGWFLLHYVSRDEVALLDRGTGGVPEVRNTIDGYEEVAPLYGFLQYRRRKVVLSYLPEGLSRLIQVFTLAKSSDLTESSLSSACLLHTASGSITSSSSSLRRRRLMEITEDAEENTGSKDAAETQSPNGDGRRRSFSQLSESTIVAPPAPLDTQPSNGDQPPTVAKDSNDTRPSVFGDRDAERRASVKNLQEELSHPSTEPRKSSQSARPSLRDLERSGIYSPKVKRGPRPSVDGSGRPRTAGNLSRSIEQQRPVASLPAGVRSSSLRKSNPFPTARPRSHGSTVASTPNKSAPLVPPLLVPPLSASISRPPLSPGAKSLSALSSSTTSHEKERLMKALQLRKTQMERKAHGVNQDQSVSKGATVSSSEDKENIGDAKVDEQEPVTLEISKPPMTETQPPVAMESTDQPHNKVHTPSNQTAKPNSTEELSATHTPADNTSDFSATHEDAQPSTDRNEASEVDGSPEAQTHRVPETQAVEGDSALPVDSAPKSGPGSPSAVINVPPEDKSLKAPEEIATLSQPTEKPPISGEQAATDPTGDSTTSPIHPQSIPLHTSPPSGSQPNSLLDPSTVITPDATGEQHDLAPEADHRKDKRKPLLEPIQVPTPEYSDDDNFSDDSLMEELKSATVEEAKPISVGKSPLSPGYSNSGNDRSTPDAWKNSRAVSNPSAIGSQPANLHALAVGRSVSTPYTDADGAVNPVLVAKKINVSSGISKRIKALEKFSNGRDIPSTASSNLAAPSASSSFETLRKRASVSLGGHSDPSGSRHGSYSPETFSRASSLRRRDSSTSAKRTLNSVSVTARIVRESGETSEQTNGASGEGVLNLHPSQLTVEHETSEVPPSQNLIAESGTNKSEKRNMSTSSASSGHQSILPSIQRPESEMSISSASRNEGALPLNSDAPSSEDKKESRTSRLLRRMSSITAHPRKGAVGTLSPMVKEEGGADETQISEAVDIGEVNVQFPDTLLWKRRFVRIDNRGFLVLTPGNVDSSNRNMIKRYHLTEFRTPCLPDEDRQELPNSILLDFVDGGTLQCACESRQGQALVLHTLVTAHRSLHYTPS